MPDTRRPRHVPAFQERASTEPIMRPSRFPSGRPSWVLSCHPGEQPADAPQGTGTIRGRHGVVLALALGASFATSVAFAQAEGTAQRETEGPAALRTPTEQAIFRDSNPATPLRLGDFFLFDRGRPEGMAPSGLRLSTGLFGPSKPMTLFDSPQLDAAASQAYLGLGYTRAWMKSQLSLSADVGMTSPTTNTMSRLRGVMTGSQNLDDAMRDLRWSPVMAVNVNYAF
jgi:hypothetical protein